MSEIELPVNSCPLCDSQNIISHPYLGFNRSRSYDCPNCGPFIFSYKAYLLTPIRNNQDFKIKLSYYVRHNTSIEKPIFIEANNYENFLTSVKLPQALEKLDNFLLWFGDKSNYSMDCVGSNTKHLRALLGCSDHIQVIQLLGQLWDDGIIKMEMPTTDSPTKFLHFDLFRARLTRIGLEKIKIIKTNKSPIGFNIPKVSVESILHQEETFILDLKGSFKLDLNRLLKGDGNKELNDDIALKGVLKEIVAFLNTSGGTILIGALEVDKFDVQQINKIHNEIVGNYYIIGIKLENDNIDKYQLKMRDLISSHISRELVELIDISFVKYFDFTLCQIVINKASHKWYYLDNIFYVREGNRTIRLEGDLADSYKRRNPR